MSWDQTINPVITVRIQHHYGERRVYPVCEIAKKLALLAQHVTLTNRDIDVIKSLGFDIEVEAQTL